MKRFFMSVLLLGASITILFTLSRIGNKKYVYVSGEELKYTNKVVISKPYTESSLEIAIGAGEIEIYNSIDNQIALTIEYREYEPQDADFNIKNGKLTYETKSGVEVYVDKISGSVPSRIPLVLDTGSGNVILSGYDNSSYLKIDTGSGDVMINNCQKLDKLIIDTGSGNVKANNLISINHATFDTGSGDIEISNLTGIVTAEFDTGSGIIRIEDYSGNRLVADTGSGDVLIENSVIDFLVGDTGSGDIIIKSSEINKYQVDQGSGDLIIDKNSKRNSNSRSF